MAAEEVIKAEATIKECKITDTGGKLNFTGMTLQPNQYRLIAKLIKAKEPINLIISQQQTEMFIEDDG